MNPNRWIFGLLLISVTASLLLLPRLASSEQAPIVTVGQCYQFQLGTQVAVDASLRLPPPYGLYQLEVLDVRDDGWMLARDRSGRVGGGEMWVNLNTVQVVKPGC